MTATLPSNHDDIMASPEPAPTWQPESEHRGISGLGIILITITIGVFVLATSALFLLRQGDQRRKKAQIDAALRRAEGGQSNGQGDQYEQQNSQVDRASVAGWRNWWKYTGMLKRELPFDHLNTCPDADSFCFSRRSSPSQSPSNGCQSQLTKSHLLTDFRCQNM